MDSRILRCCGFRGRFGIGGGVVGGRLYVAGHATLAYALAIVAMFGVSAAYHRVEWGSDVARAWMRRLDHSMIYLFIAGTYTPFARRDMPRSTGHVVLAIVLGAALVGIALMLFWPEAPRWLSVALYLLLGWVGVCTPD